MRGDRLLIEPQHRRAADVIIPHLIERLESMSRPLVVSIGGESGSGKSELGAALADAARQRGLGVLVLQQDDYFHLPPKTNDRRRRESIDWVGPSEVDLRRLEENLRALRSGARSLVKPLVDYDADTIFEEALATRGLQFVIVEGTYTTSLDPVDVRVFIARTFQETVDARRRRRRDAQDAFVEQVLAIEHEIIKQHRDLADAVVGAGFEVDWVAIPKETGSRPARQDAAGRTSATGGDP